MEMSNETKNIPPEKSVKECVCVCVCDECVCACVCVMNKCVRVPELDVKDT